ncbi:tetratricopeptide repeat protein [Bacteroidota bacterium]
MKKENKHIITNYIPDRVISIGLIIICVSLAIFGLISLTDPNWLAETSYENKKVEVSELVREGIWLSRNNNDRDAIAKFDEALTNIPDFVEAVINKGVSYKRLKMYDAALSEFNKALKMSPPDSSNIYSNIKDIFLELGDTLKATEFFRKSIESNRLTIDKYMKKGNYYLSLRNLDSALTSYNTALEKRLSMDSYFIDELYKGMRDQSDSSEINSTFTYYNPEKVKIVIEQCYDKKCFELNLFSDKGLAKNYNKIGFVIGLMGDYEQALNYFQLSVRVWRDYRDANENIRFINEKLQNK